MHSNRLNFKPNCILEGKTITLHNNDLQLNVAAKAAYARGIRNPREHFRASATITMGRPWCKWPPSRLSAKRRSRAQPPPSNRKRGVYSDHVAGFLGAEQTTPASLLLILLIRAGIEVNPGPRVKCCTCNKAIKNRTASNAQGATNTVTTPAPRSGLLKTGPLSGTAKTAPSPCQCGHPCMKSQRE